MKLTENEVASKKALRNAKLIAMTLLLSAAIGYALAIRYAYLSPYMLYVKAFCEASMVGGLADWFAVVALFKHPLGLPIPHTAILPKNQNRIAKQVALFIETNFLQPNVIALKIKNYRPSQLFLNWLSLPENKIKLINIMVNQLSNVLKNIDPAWFRELIISNLDKKISGEKIGHVSSMSLMILQKNKFDDKLVDYIVSRLSNWLNDPISRKK